jgi:adenylate cyclase
LLGSATAALRSEAPRHALIVALLVHLALVLVIGLEYLGLLPRLERPIYDAFLRRLTTSEGVDPSVVIVEYTEADEKRYSGPLPDGKLAELLERLAAARPLAIGLDLIRDRPEPRDGDPAAHERLSAALVAHEFIIGLVKDTKGGFDPPPALADQPGQLGFADMLKDPDGVVRRGLLFMTTAAGTRPSLALQLAARRLVADGITPVWQGDRLELGATQYVDLHPQSSSLYAAAEPAFDDRGYQFLLTFPACPGAYRSLSVNDVLEGSDDDLEFANRLVLIGNTVRLSRDYFSVPVDCGGALPGEMFGVHLHAQVASQLIRQANGTARPVETLDQRLGSPALGQAAGLAWTWLWCLLGGLTAASVASPWRLAAAAAGEAIVIAAVGLTGLLVAGLWLPVVPPLAGAAGAAGLVVVYLMTRARGEREQLMNLFAGSVSDRVAKVIWKTRKALGGPGRPPPKLMTATVLFSDIRGFSTISTMMPESRLATWLDLYMEPMVDIVERYDGVIEKFAGDGLTVEFGVPEARETDAEIAADAQAAVDCALAMADSLLEINRAMAKRDLPQIAIRVGIHSGPLMVGVIGGAKRWQFSIIGDTANTAARLESYGKDDPRLTCEADHCRILISEATYHLLEGRYAVEAVGTLEMRNRGPISVYRVLGLRGTDRGQSGGPSR